MANKAFTVKHGLNPSTDNSVDLGTSSLEFKDLYIDGTAFLDAIGFGSVAMTLPTDHGINGQVLKTNGSNALAWANDTAGTITALNNQTEDRLVTIGSTTTQLDGEANLTFDGTTLNLNHASSNPTLTYSEGGTERGSVAYIPAANELRLIAKEAGSSMSLQTANSEAIYISSSQQVGIGTSSPSYALSVESAAQVNDDARFSTSLYDTTAMAAGVGAGIAFWGRHTSGSFSYLGAIHGAKSNGTDSNLDGDLVFSTRQHSGGTMSERVRVDSSGRILAGTTSTYNADYDNLVVASSGNTGITIASTSTTATTGISFADGTDSGNNTRAGLTYDHNAGLLKVNSNNATAMVFDTNQQVGIRTASPNANLEVVGNQEQTAQLWGTSSGSAYTKITLTGNDRANLAHQRTDSVGTTATTIFSQSALGSYRDMGLVLVTGRVHDVNKFFYDLVFLVGSEDGKTVAIRSDSYGSGVATRSYTTNSNSLKLAMSSGTYKVRCVGLMSSSEY